MPSYFANTGANAQPDNALHGGKGAGLLGMAQAGLPVPEALILTTECWKTYRETSVLPVAVDQAIMAHLDAYPDSMFSVRSGAPISMPGMMDTVLNVGVTPELDDMFPGATRRYVTSWLGIVHGVPKDRTAELCDLVNARSQGHSGKFRKLLTGVVQASEQVAIPQSRFDQVAACVKAVFDSWDTPRAVAYRKMHNIDGDMGTGCVIQRMVMGTAGGFSGSGVMFSRDPATGEAKMRGEFAVQAQGEEVVSGEITPDPISELPLNVQDELAQLCSKLEGTYGDVQDIEFTYEKGELYVLQTRTAKMSARARIVTACALAKELHQGLPVSQLAYLKERVTRGMIAKCQVPVVHTEQAPISTGLAASPGAVSGKVVFRATPLHKVDKDCILVAVDTQPEDFPIMAKAGAIWTAAGGFTCHSAVVARGIGVPAVVGCGGMAPAIHQKGFEVSGLAALIKEGMTVTLDGTSGQVWLGECKVEQAAPPREIYSLLHEIVQGQGVDVPAETYYRDCGLGEHVVLPLNPMDLPGVERQLARAERLMLKGKTVALAFELEGLGEDMFSPTPASLFGSLAEHYGPDMEDMTVLYGVPKEMHEAVATGLKVKMNTSKISVLDLLDLLGD